MEGSTLLSRVHETMHISIHPKKSVTVTVNRLSLYMFEDEFVNFSKMILESVARINENVEILADFGKGQVYRSGDALRVAFLSIDLRFSLDGYESFVSLIERGYQNYVEHFKNETIDDDILAFLQEIEKANTDS